MITVTGNKEIDAVLKRMPDVLTHRVLQSAHAESATPLVTAAHLLAPVGKTGNLADSIGVEKVPASAGTLGLVNVGPRRKGGKKGHHGHLVEYGKTNRDGSKSKPKPFMEPAFERTKGEVEWSITKNIGVKLYQFMRRTIRNA